MNMYVYLLLSYLCGQLLLIRCENSQLDQFFGSSLNLSMVSKWMKSYICG